MPFKILMHTIYRYGKEHHMLKVKYNSFPLYEKRQNETRDAKLSLVEEHASRDQAIQNEIRKDYSLSQELSILRKEIFYLHNLINDTNAATKESNEFLQYYDTVEACKEKVKEQDTIFDNPTEQEVE